MQYHFTHKDIYIDSVYLTHNCNIVDIFKGYEVKSKYKQCIVLFLLKVIHGIPQKRKPSVKCIKLFAFI